MNFSELFIRRPVATSLLMLAIALFGFVAYRGLPVSDLPNVDFPTILVSAGLSGANPDTMASAVATPLEKEFSTIEGLDSMTSSSGSGSTSITLQFALSRSLDAAAQDVQSAITRATRLLPPGMPNPPTFRKVNPADQPILYMALTSDTMPLYDLDEYAETLMAQRISMVSGVAQVSVFGAAKYAVRIRIDPEALAVKGIGIDEVTEVVQRWNVNMPTGELYGPNQAYTIQATGQLTKAELYRPMVIAYRNGSPVRLRDIADVVDSIEEDKVASWYNDQSGSRRAIVLAVQRQPGQNTIAVADSVKALMPVFQAQLPPSVRLNILYDRSATIRESFEDVQFTMVLTLGLVVMVIFLFLRNVSATIIPSLALPFSIVGTFAVMYLLGYSLNNLSMMALILSVGYVVDDAIVMLENIVRHMEHGEAPLQAALSGSREIGFTIVSMTLSLAAVFIPVLFLGGIVGRLFREFAVTITAAILISGLVSVTLTPMLSSRFLRPPSEERHGWFYRLTESIFQGMLSLYGRTLRWTLKFRPVTLAISFLILAATVWLFLKTPKGFIPSEDTDQIFVVTEAVQGTSYPVMFRYQQQVAEILRTDPNVDQFMSSAGGFGGGGGLGGPNFGRMFLHLKPRSERKLSADELMEYFRPKLSVVPGMRVFMQNPPTIRIGGQLTRSLYQFTLQGTDIDELYRAAQKMEREMVAMPLLQDVNTDLLLKKPQVNVVIDRDKSASLKVTAEQIEDALYSAYGARWISTIYAPNNQYRVIMESRPEFQDEPNALSLLHVRSGSGTLVPLDTVARLTESLGPQAINHSGQLPSVTISFNLKPGASLGDAVDQIQQAAERLLPATVTTTFQGAAQAFQQAGNLWLLLIVAILVIYIVLGILYESYIHPITILSGLPSAGFGALLTLMVFRVELNIYSFVGLIMLIGIVKKNAIMQIDFALAAERQEGKPPMEAIYQGCLIRFRPIMMTTMAALFGSVPIALGYGAGGEARQPLGLAVVGGLLFSQLVTLYLTPVYYTYLASLQSRLQRRVA
ncbi:MAG TPA: efflux RND transporter permease subunit [Bryobacteraceae bacterium]|nr:efflux RND transporter permease subunit [Bryobacteraceae bacterium]